MSLQITQNKTGYVNPTVGITDTGWSVSDGYAVHTSCNSGKIISLTSLGLIVGRQYKVRYTIDQYSSGNVNVLLGTTAGVNRTANGNYSDTLICTGAPQISFFSDGNLRVSAVSFYDTVTGFVSGTTVVFNEKANRWTSEYSAVPEQWIKFIDNLFSIKNGQVWLHNSNDLRNNFYGVQYGSKIVFYVNISPETVKNFYSIRIQGSSPWGSQNDGDVYVFPHVGKPNGQKSRLKTGNYRNLQGDFFADFLRDLSDPRFNDTLTALFQGASLQGKVLQITIENNDTVTARLVSIDVSTMPQNYTYTPNQ